MILMKAILESVTPYRSPIGFISYREVRRDYGANDSYKIINK